MTSTDRVVADVQAADLDLKAIPLDRIVPDPNQPRRSMLAETLEGLASSIREQGVLQPIEVDYDPGRDLYVMVHGERRWKAAKMAGLEAIPAIVKPGRLDRATRLIRQLIENIQRENLNDVDRARALVSLRDQMQAELDARLAEGEPLTTVKGSWKTKVSWIEVGKRVGLSSARMTQLRALLDLPDAIREDVRRGLLTEYESRVYRGLLADQQRELHRAWREQGLTAAQVKDIATLLKIEAKAPDPRSVAEVIALVTAPPPPVTDTVDYVEPGAPEESLLPPAEAEVESSLLAEEAAEPVKEEIPAEEPAEELPGEEAPVEPLAPPAASVEDTVLGLLASLSPAEALSLINKALARLQETVQETETITELLNAVSSVDSLTDALRQQAKS